MPPSLPLLFCLLLFAINPAYSAPKRIAMFSEPEFPAQPAKELSWYRETLTAGGYEVSTLSLKELESLSSSEGYDILFLPTGNRYPLDGEAAIGLFLDAGKMVVVDGHALTSDWKAPAEVEEKAAELRKEHLKGKGSKAYRDYLFEQGLSSLPSNLLRYDAKLKRWKTPIDSFYYLQFAAKAYSEEFHLEPWPNFNHHSLGRDYGRPWDEPLALNPLLDKSDWAFLPSQVTPPAGDAPDLRRVQMPHRESQQVIEFGNDLLISLYLFANPSGEKRTYAGYPHASRSLKDRDGDFYIYRMNRPQRPGSTLVHFGTVGRALLAGEHGKEVLLKTLELAAKPLPGEKPKAYIDAFNDTLKAQSEFTTAALDMIATTEKAATFFHYQNRNEEEQAALRQLSNARRQYERLSGEATVHNSNVWQGTGEATFRELSKKCRQAAAKLSAIAKSYADLPTGSMPQEIQNPIKSYQLGFGRLSMPTASRWKRLWPLLKENGFTFGPYYLRQAGGFELMRQLPDLDVGYRLAHHPFDSDFIETVEDGVLDPETGQIRKRKFKVYDTPERLAAFKGDAAWFLEKVNATPGVGNVVYLSERDLEWSLWGEWMRSKFLAYLRSKYDTIAALNETWGSDYGDFKEIALPTVRPKSRQQHALWEDWTRYREIYYIEKEVKPLQEIVSKHAPALRSTAYGSYNRQPQHPANGINYHELFKGFNPSTYEMGPSRAKAEKQILSADITAFTGRNLTSEWSAMYFPLGFAPDRTDLIKQELWNGVGWGQLGIQIYSGATAVGHYDGNLLDFHENPLANLAQFNNVAADFRKIAPLLMDGKRQPASIQVIYSPTTRRHTSWPGEMGDRPMSEVAAWWLAGRCAHYHTRALDEGAALERPFESGLVVVSDVEYLTKALQERLQEYLEQGGSVLISPASGRFNEYGAPKDSLMSLAGIIPSPAQARAVRLPQSTLELAGGVEAFALTPLFPEGAETLLTYDNGATAAVKVRHGKGTLIVLGFALAPVWEEWGKQPASTVPLLDRIAEASGVERQYQCADPDLVVWPWSYQEKDYLILTYPITSKLAESEPATEGFPFRRASNMIPVKLKVKGHRSAKDVLLNTPLPSTREGDWTVFSGLISAPGGVVLELGDTMQKEAGRSERESKAAAPVAVTSASKPSDRTDQIRATAPTPSKLPFRGQLFSSEGPFHLGDYVVGIRTQTDGAWDGKVWMDVEHHGEMISAEVSTGTTHRFQFLGSTLVAECESAAAYMPSHWTGKLTEEPRTAATGLCRAVEEDYHGHSSVVLENDYVRVRVLPKLGGRIIEFASADGGVNHLFANAPLLARGGASSWAPFGGIHYNPGGFPGAFWDLEFEYRIERKEDEVTLVLNRSRPVRWSQGNRGSGTGSLASTITVRKGEAVARISVDLYNEASAPAAMKLRTHGMFALVGRDDSLAYPTAKEAVRVPFADLSTRAAKGRVVANTGGWMAVTRAGAQQNIVQSFSPESVANLLYAQTEGAICFEATTAEWTIEPGKKRTFDYTLTLLRGLEGLDTFADGTGLWLQTDSGRDKEGSVILKGGIATARESVDGVLRVRRQGPTGDARHLEETARLTPLTPRRWQETLPMTDAPDGIYRFEAAFEQTVGAGLVASTTLQRDLQAVSHQQRELAQLGGQLKQLLQVRSQTAEKQTIASGLIALAHAEAALQSGNEHSFREGKERVESILATLQQSPPAP